MEINIKGEAKEIAALVLEVQERQAEIIRYDPYVQKKFTQEKLTEQIAGIMFSQFAPKAMRDSGEAFRA